jgi:hypothetical protein
VREKSSLCGEAAELSGEPLLFRGFAVPQIVVQENHPENYKIRI